MAKSSRISVRDLERETKKFQAPTTEKERAVIEAALALISERGIDGATTAEIAKRAGVTERTLFRYFPSKTDLVRRVLFPLLLHIGLMRNWMAFETLLRTQGTSFRSWYVMLATDRLATVARNPGLGRTVMAELLQNDELRNAMAKVWRQHIWEPMLESLEELQAKGAIRKEINVRVLARAIHCLQIGYFLTRYLFAPGRRWDDASEIEKMAEILTCGSEARRT